MEGTKRTGKVSRRALHAAWTSPAWIALSAYCVLVARSAAALGWTSTVLGAAGAFIGVVAVALAWALLSSHPAVQLLGGLVGAFLASMGVVSFAASGGRAYGLLFAGGLVLGAGGTWSFVDSVLAIKKRGEWSRRTAAFWRSARRDRRMAHGAAVVLAVSLGLASAALTPRLVDPGPARQFVVTDELAAEYDLVVYFPKVAEVDDQVAQLFAEVNATLSFPLLESQFAPGDPAGEAAAAAVATLNALDVPVEVWPLFDRDAGHYPSLSEIDRWDDLYAAFNGWVERNGLQVQYLLWDVESEGEGATNPFESWPEPWRSVGRQGAEAARVATLSRNWPSTLEAVREVAATAAADGVVTRVTTHTLIWDLFDGDDDLQQQAGLPIWGASGSFQYVSMMAYRGCEWGGAPADASMVYEVVRASALANATGEVAVCLGCINYTPYPTVQDVADDVRLALAAGATSVRLFQANSWIDGVGEGEGPAGPIHGGPAHGLDGESGLRQLLLECRRGGNVTLRPSQSARTSHLGMLAWDATFDLARPSWAWW